MLISIQGAYDLHIHTAPCLFPRLATDREMVLSAREYGMDGVMLKCHHESSVSRAAILDKEFDDIEVYGGIVLNTCVGGVNPAAVEAALRLGGKAVWMPTFDSKRHVEIHGAPGKYALTEKVTGIDHEGITILKDGVLIPEAMVVMELAKQYDVLLGTGHCSEEECFALADLANDIGFNKLLITHAHYKVPNIGIEGQKLLIEKGAMIEFGYCTVSHAWAANSVDNAVLAIKENGAQHYIIVSDAGQYNNPMPAECMRIFAQAIHERGINPEDINRLMIDNPQYLLGIK